MNPDGTAAPYFFLSYARPLPASGFVRTDHWVRKLYDDLSERVRRITSSQDDRPVGFYDDLIPTGADWNDTLSRALGRTEIFVPLYSPSYFLTPWTMRELESFRARLTSIGRRVDDNHLIPVLWTPLTATAPEAEAETANRLGADVPDYTENGLRALCRLDSYQPAYEEILTRLAARIVATGDGDPLGSQGPLQLTDLPTAPPPAGKPLLISVVAPDDGSPPKDGPAQGYGPKAADWRPYAPKQSMSLASYAAAIAEQMGLNARTVDAQADREPIRESPSLLLIDPWILSRRAGRGQLAQAIDHLPVWTSALVAMDTGGSSAPRGLELAGEAMDMLRVAGLSERRAQRADSMDESVTVMAELINGAQRRYLRSLGPRPDSNHDRMSLRQTDDDLSMPTNQPKDNND